VPEVLAPGWSRLGPVARVTGRAGGGGGTVVLQAGTYPSAPIKLKSNMTFELQKDATLLGSPDHQDYPVIQEFRQPGHQALVSATNAQNVSITGEGVIDGNGESWWQAIRGAPNIRVERVKLGC